MLEEPVPLLPQEGENTGQENITVQDTTTSFTVRHNPVNGLEETTLDKYSHIDKSISFLMVRGAQAFMINEPPENSDNPQLLNDEAHQPIHQWRGT